MPFITEEIWHILDKEASTDCILSSYPKEAEYSDKVIDTIESLKLLVSKIRDVRNAQQLKPKEKLSLSSLQ